MMQTLRIQQRYRVQSGWVLAVTGCLSLAGGPLWAQAGPIVPPGVNPPTLAPAPGQLPPGTTPATPDATQALTINAGEIRLDGLVETVNADGSSLVLDVTEFTLPTGKSQALAVPKPKTVLINALTWLHQGADATQKAAITDLAATMPITIIGRDMGTGQGITAREIAVNAPAGVAAPDPTTDIVALRQELTAQIAQLQAEVQRLNIATGLVPVAPGAANGTTPQALTRVQMNDMMAGMRQEIGVSLQSMARRLDALEAAARRAGLTLPPTGAPGTPGAPGTLPPGTSPVTTPPTTTPPATGVPATTPPTAANVPPNLAPAPPLPLPVR